MLFSGLFPLQVRRTGEAGITAFRKSWSSFGRKPHSNLAGHWLAWCSHPRKRILSSGDEQLPCRIVGQSSQTGEVTDRQFQGKDRTQSITHEDNGHQAVEDENPS